MGYIRHYCTRQQTFILAFCISAIIETQDLSSRMCPVSIGSRRPLYLSGMSLDVTEQQLHGWMQQNREAEPQVVALFSEHIATKPVCQWIGDWTAHPTQRVTNIINHAKRTNSLYQIVLYNIPNRDAGGFSAGGAGSRDAYLDWVGEVASAISSAEGVIIVEPDALAHSVELSMNKREERLRTIEDAVTILRSKCRNAHIYIDAGHPAWLNPADSANLLVRAGIHHADGISLNIANSHSTESCHEYGLRILETISGSHGMVIDVSRNGAGPPPPHITGKDGCINVESNRLGEPPTLSRQILEKFSSRLHGLLWIKVPGESDGEYKAAPRAGMFWPEGALLLLKNQKGANLSLAGM